MSLRLPFASPHLVLGGAKSGKSVYAEKLITLLPPPYFYIATAEVLDDEMKNRVHQHRMRRGEDWQTIETPLDLVNRLIGFQRQQGAVLVDCLTLWLSNLLLKNDSPLQAVQQLCEVLKTADYPLVLVSNEVGAGIVPENALARLFRDLAGKTNQQVASVCKGVTCVMAGIPLVLKNAL